jgi:hypothetical protein
VSTATPNKTDSVEVLAHQAATHPITIVGSAIDCRTKRSVTIHMYHAYVESTADTNPGSFKVQVRPDAGDGTVNEHWITVAEYQAAGTTPDTENMTATEPAGETTLAVASTTGFAANQDLYIQDTGTLADSEWAECQEIVSNTSIVLIDGLANQKDSGDVIWNGARRFVCQLDLNAGESFRVIWTHEGATGANGHVKALATTYDSDNIAA